MTTRYLLRICVSEMPSNQCDVFHVDCAVTIEVCVRVPVAGAWRGPETPCDDGEVSHVNPPVRPTGDACDVALNRNYDPGSSVVVVCRVRFARSK